MTHLPRKLLPLLSLANWSGDVVQFRAALRHHNKDRLKRHAQDVLDAITYMSDVSVYLMKYLSVHEAIGSDPSVYATAFTWTINGRQMSDAEAMRLLAFLSENDLLQPDTGLLYEACRSGWIQLARMLVAEGRYRPLAWPGYPDDGPEEERRRAELLLEVVDPSVDDLQIIRRGFSDGGVGASIIDQAIQKKAVAHSH